MDAQLSACSALSVSFPSPGFPGNLSPLPRPGSRLTFRDMPSLGRTVPTCRGHHGGQAGSELCHRNSWLQCSLHLPPPPPNRGSGAPWLTGRSAAFTPWTGEQTRKLRSPFGQLHGRGGGDADTDMHTDHGWLTPHSAPGTHACSHPIARAADRTHGTRLTPHAPDTQLNPPARRFHTNSPRPCPSLPRPPGPLPSRSSELSARPLPRPRPPLTSR